MKRPRSHVLETESKRALTKIIPDEWVCRELSDDYGLDFMVEIFDAGESTGRIFYLQLKGTDQIPVNNTVKVRLEIATLEYCRSIPVPILLLVYSTKSTTFWSVWLNNYLTSKRFKAEQKTAQITLREDQRTAQSFFLELPNRKDWAFHNEVCIRSNVKTGLGSLYHKRLMQFVSGHTGDLAISTSGAAPWQIDMEYTVETCMITIAIRDSLLGNFAIAPIGVKTGESWLLESGTKLDSIPTGLIEPLFVLSNMILFRSPETVFQFWRVLLGNYSGRFVNLEAVTTGIRYAVKNGLLSDLEGLTRDTLEHGQYELFQWLNMAILLSESRLGLDATRVYQANLRDAIERVGDQQMEATLTYSLANSVGNTGQHRTAVALYIRAARLDPDYKSRGYWLCELGSSLYNIHHYRWAERCYARALPLMDRHPNTQAYLGDCQFRQMALSDALHNYQESEEEWGSQYGRYVLRTVVCDLFIKRGLDGVSRDPREARQLIERALMVDEDKQQQTLLDRAVERDPLNPKAWFHNGVALHKHEQYYPAIMCFVACSVVEDGNKDALINAFVIGRGTPEAWIRAAILDCLVSEYGEGVIKDVYMQSTGRREDEECTESDYEAIEMIHDMWSSYKVARTK